MLIVKFVPLVDRAI